MALLGTAGVTRASDRREAVGRPSAKVNARTRQEIHGETTRDTSCFDADVLSRRGCRRDAKRRDGGREARAAAGAKRARRRARSGAAAGAKRARREVRRWAWA
ncbi:hypothetical protein GCM10017591_03540 [Microbacterium dextranolyticum]|uniref:Uncharacterized protein n=1 Tax=Microbacterium dextranolyticum TaxID=36806 RepID=A0A9W6M5A4_9MICO|nr:hypothetical protein GCM10017591_03540 [Microbacterium dextranolyticum]